MLNLKNNENDWVFDEICKKKKNNNNNIKLKFQKMKGTFLDSIPWLKSPTAIHINTLYMHPSPRSK